jgi:hypothetical protein
MIRRVASLSAALAALAALAAFLRVRALRSDVLASWGAPLYRVLPGFAAEARALAIAAAAVLALLLLRAIAGVAWLRRRPEASTAIAAQLAPTAILVFAAAAVLRGALALLWYHDPCGDPLLMDQLRYETFAAHAAPLEQARAGIVALVVIGSAVILALARRDRHAPASPSVRAIVVSMVLFLGGFAAFLATRDLAQDAAHPPPLHDLESRTGMSVARAADLPLVKVCLPIRDAPQVIVEDRGWSVDGSAARDEGELRAQLAQKRDLWRQVVPNKPFPGVVMLMIPASASEDTVWRTLAAVLGAGYTEADVIGRREARSWPTRTLGKLWYAPRICRARLSLPARLPRGKLWDDISMDVFAR